MRPLLCLATAFVFCASAGAELIWVEGEAAVASSMREHGWYNSVKKTELSGGDWLSHFAGGEMPVAAYQFVANQAGDHHFWLRANPVGAALSVRIDGGEWRPVSLKKNEQNLNIAADGKALRTKLPPEAMYVLLH